MKTRSLICALLLGASSAGNAQWNTLGGNTINLPTEYLGCDALSTEPLRLKTEANQPIDWYTNAIHRMRLWENQTNTINSLTNINQNGFVGISDQPLFFDSSVGAFSRLHLVDRGAGTTNFGYYAQQLGYRRWQRNGVTFTGNSDQGYVGQKYLLDGNNAPLYDKSDMVLQWSNDVQGEDGPDRLRFLFTSSRDGVSPHGSASEEGLEAMRFTPVDAATINAGLGDFYRGNIIDPLNVTEPTERLDILNGRLRIRELPTTSSNDAVSKYMVVDNTGVVHWRNLPAAATPGCEWFRVGGTSKFVLSGTDTPSGGSCPDRAWLYGIGTASPTGKFTVVHNASERATDAGIRVNYTAGSGTGSVFGMHSTIGGVASNATVANGIGLLSELYRPTLSGTGVLGRVSANESTAAMTSSAGVSGIVSITAGSSTWSYGTMGEVTVNGGTGTHIHGGYFVSKVFNPAGSVSNSKGLFTESVVSAGTVTNSYGLHAVSRNAPGSGTTATSYGVYADSYSSTTLATSYGLYARGASGSTTNYGVKAYAQGASGSTNYGIHAATNWAVNGVDWAGYFSGSVYSPYGTWQPSDAGLKSNVNDLSMSSAADLVNSVQLHTYTYAREQFPHMNLPEGEQVGVLAQELEAILPGSVRSAVEPAVYDEDGAIQFDAVEFKAVNYGSLIPYLVAAYQDERRNREELESRLDHLEQALAACCANPDGSRMQDQGLDQPSELDGSLNGSEKLRIQPNPFNKRTTVLYTLDRGGRTQLLVNSSDGRDLRVLQEANLEAGSYQFDWNTAALAPGMYYVTLLLDGQPVVKKVVKVDR